MILLCSTSKRRTQVQRPNKEAHTKAEEKSLCPIADVALLAVFTMVQSLSQQQISPVPFQKRQTRELHGGKHPG